MSHIADFLMFRTFITPKVLAVLYLAGVVILVAVSLFMMTYEPPKAGLSAIVTPLYDPFRPFVFYGGLIIITLGNVIWRLVCENFAVQYTILSEVRGPKV
jgi:uncharacterized protein YggT (Ycf19 family)